MQTTGKRKYVVAGSVGVATFLIYTAALRNDFVNWDDNGYVLDNPHIRSLGGQFFRWAFTQFYESNWHPLTWISHALDYAVWELNPAGHHLTSIVIHAVNACIVVLLSLKLIEAAQGKSRADGNSWFPGGPGSLIAAGVTGLLFGIHPLHVESVAWVAERKDVLCALFFLLSIMMYAKAAWGMGHGIEAAWSMKHGAEGKKSRASTPCFMHHAVFTDKYYLAALGFFILALLSKPMAVTLPVVLLILDWHPFHRICSLKNLGSRFIEKIPFVILALASSWITIIAHRSGGAVQSFELAPLSIRLYVAAQAIVGYLGKMLWPLDLVPFYSYPKAVSPLSMQYIGPLILAAGLTTLCFFAAKKRKLWLSVWAYYLATLLPVLGIIQVGGQAMADRYTYLPGIGLFLIAGLGAAWLSEKMRQRRILKIAAVAGVLLFVLLSYLAVAQISVWRNSLSLWNYVLEKDPGVVQAYNNRGLVFMNMGLLRRSVEDYSMAIAKDPACSTAYYNRGVALSRAGLFQEAITDLDRAVALDPSFSRAYNYRGKIHRRSGRKGQAAADFQKACQLGDEDGCSNIREKGDSIAAGVL